MPLVANRVARRNVLQTNHRADIACENFLDVLALVGVHFEQAPNALGLSRARVQNRFARFQLSGIHPNKGQLADEGIGHDLEGQRRERLLVIGLARNFLPVLGIDAPGLRGIQWRRQELYHCIEQRLHTLVLESGTDDNREQLQRDRRLAQRSAQSFCANLFAFQELVQNVVVIFGDGLNQLRMERFRFLLQLSRNRLGDVLGAHGLVVPDDGLHVDQVDDAPELVFLPDWNLDRYGFGIKALADGIDGVLEISTHFVDLVNEANSRDAVFIRLPPYFFRLRLYAMNGVKHRDGAVKHAERALDLGREIDVAGRINNIDANIAPGAGGRSGRNRDAALLLLLHPVHCGRAFVDLSDAVRSARIEQDALRRSGLTGIDVRHDADVPATL